ncbi:hypothetical protein LOTGIDRAFT_134511 [Lottia gigantea]|uniref:G-protein coupled receptors family 1 profile domain-containing protein n=1 Tax=Lottia gigantea TaxID=225164 RepID=V3YWT2_LOTGI|nr:hypothetical protein LOTGIDRAFT_134511 [Lottia gigantea]ESO82498.1 hypothetical protein LOTGIDRAFT_134511 [Lottia gigantea]
MEDDFYDNGSTLFPDTTTDEVFTGPWVLTPISEQHLIVTSVFLGLFILAAIIGNVFVIAAVVLEKSLHNVANYLILSLAVADLMVAVLVMPISVVTEISTVWFLHSEICDMYVSFDVLCCTASILHLVAIAMDRYWAVTSIDYIRNRSAQRIILMIVLVWTVALCISIPPLFGWKDPNDDPDITGQCIISQDLGYTVFSTACAFYLPMAFMIAIYIRIWQVTRSIIRKDKFGKNKKEKKKQKKEKSMKTEYSIVSDCNGCQSNKSNGKKTENGNAPDDEHSSTTNSDEARSAMLDTSNGAAQSKHFQRQREKIEMRRERKAARTLAIITGAFLICWLPFFIVALIGPFIADKVEIPLIIRSIILWLGYVNSLLNPVIYTIFSPEFRMAFSKILFGKYAKKKRPR